MKRSNDLGHDWGKPRSRDRWWLGIGLLILLLAACAQPIDYAAEPTITVFARGLLNPIGLAEHPSGAVFVAEEGTGNDDFSAGVSLILPDGAVGRFISGLPSGRDSGDLSGVPLAVVSPDGGTLFTANFDQGHVWQTPLPETPRLGEPLTPDALGTRLDRLNNVYLVNPFDMTFAADGTPVVSDASGNGVATESADGTVRFIHRFDAIDTGNGYIDPVPTGITRVGDEYFVTLTGGCPYPAGGGRLVAIDGERGERVVVRDLNMPIDVAPGPDGTVWLLEFARFAPDASCFSGQGYLADTGRLSRVWPDGTREVVVDGLNFPGAVLPRADGSLLISRVFDGDIIELRWDGAGSSTGAADGAPAVADRPAAMEWTPPADLDGALRAAIAAHELRPNPGAAQREGDTPLARLGQQLFFDPILSGDKNISCATCHHPALAMGDGRVLPIGTGGEALGPQRQFVAQVSADGALIDNPFVGAFIPRNAPTVLNSALLPQQFWDGRVGRYGDTVTTLDEAVNARALTDALTAQALFPVTSLHEMAGATLGDLPPEGIRRELVARLLAIPAYADSFAAVFGTREIDIGHVAQALAAFERRFIFTEAPWDAYLAGDDGALTEAQKRGALLFYGAADPAVNCAACHAGDLFTDLQFHNILAPQLGPGKGHGPEGRDDWGRAGVTFDARDRFRFRTAPLRNVALTAPYLHSGAYATLEDVIRHHADMVGAAESYDPSEHLPPSFYSSVRPFDAADRLATAAPALLPGLPLDDGDIGDLVAFLHGLTDPAAVDLAGFTPGAVPSGLPLDPLPEAADAGPVTVRRVAAPAAGDGPVSAPPIRFDDIAADAGLDFRHGAFRDAIYDDPAAMMGGGVCWIDYDRDGWLDLYLVNSYAEDEVAAWLADGGLPRSRLYRNVAGIFADVTDATGVGLTMRGNGCVAADFDLDGWMDLYVTADGPNALLWNQGDGTFVEGAAAAGVDAPEWNSAAAVGDVDQDGRPDLYVAAYIDLEHQIPNPSGAFPQDYYGLPDRLYWNRGDGTFVDVAVEVGLARTERGLGGILVDMDDDGDLELYIANDGQPNRLYSAEADPAAPHGFRLDDWSLSADAGDSGSGMGVAGGDYDGDGRTDLLVTNWEAELNALYRNELDDAGALTFRYSTYRIGISGLGNQMTGWGTTFADFDHDGDEDFIVINGRVPVSNFAQDAELVRYYGNLLVEGRPGQFREWTQQVGLGRDGVGPLLGRGSAAADFDNDGDLDVAINTIGGAAVLLRNDGATGRWLLVDLGRFAPGARVVVTLPDGRTLVREAIVGSSYLASEDPRLHFGLGAAESVDVLVTWPDGTEERREGVGVNGIKRMKDEG